MGNKCNHQFEVSSYPIQEVVVFFLEELGMFLAKMIVPITGDAFTVVAFLSCSLLVRPFDSFENRFWNMCPNSSSTSFWFSLCDSKSASALSVDSIDNCNHEIFHSAF